MGLRLGRRRRSEEGSVTNSLRQTWPWLWSAEASSAMVFPDRAVQGLLSRQGLQERSFAGLLFRRWDPRSMDEGRTGCRGFGDPLKHADSSWRCSGLHGLIEKKPFLLAWRR